MYFKSLGAVALAISLFSTPALAQQGPTSTPTAEMAKLPSGAETPSQSGSVLSREDLEAWLDGYMPYALQRGDVAGAVVVVVKDGKVLLQKGYGHADVATGHRVDPEATLFRPGSVSKLFTWTAVMQLVQEGRIDLDRDVNTYLDFKIPPFDGQPVTMRNLMTHTPGFQDTFRDLMSGGPSGPSPLAQYLKQNLPVRVYPPGQVPAYSNYGVALAGYIVQRVSGQSFDDYIKQHIFAPLEMDHSTFQQPPPEALMPEVASGYERASEPAKPYELLTVGPAGGATTTGADMAKFMIALLQGGEYSGHRILKAATVHMMFETPWTTISPSLDRMLLGFYEYSRNNRRIIGHDGDTLWFHSVLQLFPDDQVGLFVSMNSIGNDGAARAIREGLIDGFADRYFPPGALSTSVVPVDVARLHGAMLAGDYDGSAQGSQSVPTNFMSLANLFEQNAVATDHSGDVFASSVLDLDGRPTRFKEIAPFVWQAVDGKEKLAAKVVDGRIVMWGVDGSSPYIVFMRTPAWRNAVWLLPLLAFSVIALLFSAMAWPIGVFVRWRYGVSHSLQGTVAWSCRWMRVGTAASGLLMLAWLTTIGAMAATFSFSSALDPWIVFLHVLSVVVFPAAALVSLWNAWTICTTRSGWRGTFALAWGGVLALSCLTLLWVALVFHLIGFSVAF
nr:serine hydrolase domain-containing protein [Rhodanobacter glycinis]